MPVQTWPQAIQYFVDHGLLKVCVTVVIVIAIRAVVGFFNTLVVANAR